MDRNWKIFKEKNNITIRYRFDESGTLSTYSECIIKAPFTRILFMFTEFEYYPQLMT